MLTTEDLLTWTIWTIWRSTIHKKSKHFEISMDNHLGLSQKLESQIQWSIEDSIAVQHMIFIGCF